ncbi:MAG: NADH-quinone oxidoreductase subunit C [Acidobacteriota bacterium]
MPDKNAVNVFVEEMGADIGPLTEKKNRFYFDVDNKNLLTVVRHLFLKMGCRLSTASAMEIPQGVEVLYFFSLDRTGEYFCPRILMTNKEKPEMNSITPIVKGAEWIEREMAEYWGITFEGHPRPEPLLTRNHPKGEGLNQPFRIRRLS